MDYLQYIPLILLILFGGLRLAMLNKKSNDIIKKDDDYIKFL